MSPDEALYARLLNAPALPLPPAQADALAEQAEALAASIRDGTDALREVNAAMAALRAGRRGAQERLAATLARLELALALQSRRTRAFMAEALEGATPPA